MVPAPTGKAGPRAGPRKNVPSAPGTKKPAKLTQDPLAGFMAGYPPIPGLESIPKLFKCARPECIRPPFKSGKGLTCHLRMDRVCRNYYGSLVDILVSKLPPALTRTTTTVEVHQQPPVATVEFNNGVPGVDEFSVDVEDTDDVLADPLDDPTVRLVTETPQSFSKGQMFDIILLKLLDDMNCPQYAFEEVMRWAKGAHEADYDFNPRQ